MKGQNSGVENEANIVSALNGKRHSELNRNHSRFISQVFPGISPRDIISATQIGGQGLKPDVAITAKSSVSNVSVKTGGGNSVHQENIKYFIPYCRSVLGMTDIERDSFLMFLYGDGTTDGRGQIADRLSQDEVIKTYTSEINTIQSFIDKHKRVLTERFLIYGRKGQEKNVKADYVYHGDDNDGVWCPLDVAVDYLISLCPSSKGPTIGPLTFQTWGRNLGGVQSQEDRRNSIQIKWSSCKEDIQAINTGYLASIEEKRAETERIIGNNSHGFQNCRDIVNALDSALVMYLQPTLRNMVRTVFPDIALTDIVNAKIVNKSKSDIQIIRNGIVKNVAIYMGSGNSVHQEDFVSFLKWCKDTLHMTSSEEIAFRYVFYADGTYNNTGEVKDRLNAKADIVKQFGDYVRITQCFLDKNKEALIKRFLITGKYDGNNDPDYLFFGTQEEGVTIPYKTILNYLKTLDSYERPVIAVGPLSIQMWNRNLGGEARNEYKRNSLQVKWCSISACIEAANAMHIREVQIGMREGLSAEYDLVGLLNSTLDKSSNEWKILLRELDIKGDDIYAMKLTKQVFSPLLNRKIFPKSDVVLIRSSISEEQLSECNYLLDEDFMEKNGIPYELIEHSGISCKHPESDKFTYAKMSPNSFERVFGELISGAGCSIFERDGDLSHNHDVITIGWGVQESIFIQFASKIPGVGFIADMNHLTSEQARLIKRYCAKHIYDRISADPVVAKMIFLGEGLYPEPYVASFLYAHEHMDIASVPDIFHITTGSGRHRGIFNLVVKP